MLFKWIITGLAVWWVYTRVRAALAPAPPPPPPPRAPETTVHKRRFSEEDGEYVEYEEVE